MCYDFVEKQYRTIFHSKLLYYDFSWWLLWNNLDYKIIEKIQTIMKIVCVYKLMNYNQFLLS